MLLLQNLWDIFNDENCYLLFDFRPTFKSMVPTSRTQLKQQLQREQLLQEAERKEAEKRQQQLQQQQQQQQHESANLKVPLQSIGVDVPPQILQVRFHSNLIYYLDMCVC